MPNHGLNDHLVESSADNIITSCINLLDLINETYDPVTAAELHKRFYNSVRTGDPRKFKRGIQKVIECKRNKNAP